MFRPLHSFIVIILLVTPVYSQAPAPPTNDQDKYYGFEYGCVGISLAIVTAMQSLGSFDPTPAAKCFDTVWNSRETHEGRTYAAWTKSTSSYTIYPGMKYGAVGILLSLLEFYNITGDAKYLEWAREGYGSLMDQALNKSTLPHWGYAYALPRDPYAISITDLKYGSTGVLKLNLALYEQTQNSSLLIEGERMINWLQSTVKLVESEGVKYSVVPWYDLEDPNKPVITAYGFGLSGIIPVLHEYGEVLGDQGTKAWAYEMAKFLQSIQFANGSWPYSFEGDFISNGLDEGVAGVVQGLYEYSILRNTDEFDQTIRKGIDYLLSILVDNGTHFGIPSSTRDSTLFNNLAHGLVGVLQTLITLDRFLDEEERDLVVKGIEYLLTQQSFTILNEGEDLLFLVQPWLDEKTLDFSYSDGQAGFLKFIAQIPESYKTLISLDIDRALESILRAELVFQDEEGMWVKQRSLLPQISTDSFGETKNTEQDDRTNDLLWYIFPLVGVLIILVIVRSKMQKS